MTRWIRSIKKMKSIIKNYKDSKKSIGFVPTMGYLHEGHISLIRCAKKENDIVIVSVFVNPIQFGKNEDLDRYPRNIKKDIQLCEKEKVDILFNPLYKEMYPKGFKTYIVVEDLTSTLCGRYRPNHFKGVTTVVAKLFNIVKPDRAYFGKKDYQQLVVIKQMVQDLNMDTQVIGCPIIREKDGVAMSSRNKYLSKEERTSASALNKALLLAKNLFIKGQTDPQVLKKEIQSLIMRYPKIKEIQYIEIVNPKTLKPVKTVKKGDIIALAVFVGETRLIDNIEL
ncbi:MAG: pantoate--beta-alanine ligase [Aquificae bacterium]|nr:pantoate--beta-alanine ligase [Aquificota bacterium]